MTITVSGREVIRNVSTLTVQDDGTVKLYNDIGDVFMTTQLAGIIEINGQRMLPISLAGDLNG